MLPRSRPVSFALVLSLFAAAGCLNDEPVSEAHGSEAGAAADPPAVTEDGWLMAGAALPSADLTAVTPADLFGDAAGFDGQAVLVEGTITQVCQASGCWFSFQQDGEDLYVFLEDAAGEMFTVPKDIAGRQVRVHGTFSAESDAGKHELVADAVEIAQH
ncbi:MAG: DUF4920 domain-containing protein [Planctomycetota bacterium]|jgi:hypothetical protein